MEALAKWQANKPAVDLDKEGKVRMKTGGEYSYKYASLPNIIKTVQPILADCGLTYTHLITGNEVKTLLMHPESEGVLMADRAIPNLDKVQEEGGYISYQKRYQLSALLGIATDNDNDAQGIEKEKKSALPRATDTHIDNAINGKTKGMAAGNRQVIDLVLSTWTVDSAQMRRLVEAEYRHFPDRLTEVVLLLEELGYSVTQKEQ